MNLFVNLKEYFQGIKMFKRTFIMTAVALFVLISFNTVLTYATTLNFASGDSDLQYDKLSSDRDVYCTELNSNVGIHKFTLSALPGNVLGYDSSQGAGGIYVYDGGASAGVNFTISAPSGYVFDINSFNALASDASISIKCIYEDDTFSSITLNSISTSGLSHLSPTIKNVKQVVLTSVDYAVFQGLDINARAVLAAPTIGTATAGNTQATVTFTAPASDGGVPITGYTVTSSPAGGVDSNAGTTGLSHVITGLTNGTAYTFTVTATNSAGITGLASAASNSVTPKTSQTITFANPGAKNFGTNPTLTASSDSGLTVTFTSADTSVATITAGGTLTFLKAGTATINADQAGNGMYLPATTVPQSFTVNAVAPGAPTIGTATAGNAQATVTFTAPSFTGGSAITGYTVTSSPSGGTDSNAGTTGLSHVITGLTSGTAYTFTVTATNSVGTGVASAASNSVTPKASQTITFANPGAKDFGTTPTLTASSDSGLSVTFTSADTSVATITAGGTLTFLKAGTATINADQAGNGMYLPATTVPQSFTVNAVVPGAPTIGTATEGNAQATVTFTAPSFTGGTIITGYTVTSSPSGGTDSNAGTTGLSHIITGLTNGTAYTFTVTATNSVGTGAASAASNGVTPKASQTITFASPAAQNFGTTPTITATASSGLTVTFTSADTSVATITAGGTLTFLKAGTAVINADQAGDGTYLPATRVQRSFTVNAVVPGAPTIGTATEGDAQATVTFTAPTFTGGATITGYTVTSSPSGGTDSNAGTTGLSHVITGLSNGTAYTFTVTATNSVGTGAASAVSNSVTPKASQTITFATPAAQNFGTNPTLTATASSGLTVTFTSADTSVATITAGGTLTFLKAGTAVINADQAGDGTYLPATRIQRSFTVNAVVPGVPTIGTATEGDAQATVTFTEPSFTGGATITGYTVISSPAGGIDSNAGTTSLSHIITGLSNGTVYTFTVKATNSAGTGAASAASNSVTPKASQTITFSNPGAKNFGTTPTLTATASSGLGVTFTSITPDVATITTGGAITFLTTGTATIRVEQAGNSAYLAATPVTQSFTVNAVQPGAPTIGTAAAGDAQATVTFTAPSFTGGASITGYTVTATPTAGGSDITAVGATIPITVAGLTNGTAYTFKVAATNSVGTGIASSASNSVTPIAAPTYVIALTPSGSYAFPAQIVGYPSIAEKVITITKTGTGNITGLSAVLSGVNRESFTLGTLTSATINSTSTSSAFSVKPKDGLSVGNYNAVVDVIGDNGVNQSINISFTVNSMPTPPGVPINDLIAVPGDGQVTLNFTAPEGATSVVVEKATIGTGFSAATTTSAITAASTSAVVTGLTNNVTYSFRLVVTGGSHAGISNVTTATPIAAAPLVTSAPSEPSITVVNNVEGTPDVVTVTGLNVGDIVKVYDALAAGRLLGTGTVAAGQTSATINIEQLGMNAGNVYVSITSIGKAESLRTGKAYAQEIRNSSISMSAAGFDKNINNQTDLNVAVTLNGNTLTSIKDGTNALVSGTDYVVSGNVVTIKKSYLASQSLGNTVLTFAFSSGNTQTMTLSIVDTTVTVPNNDDNTTGGGSTSGGGSAGGGSTSTTTTTEIRTVDVVAGTGSDAGTAPVKVEITRTVESGTKTDTVKLDEAKVTETIAKAVEANKDVATVLVTDLKDNPADLVEVQVPKVSSSKLADSGIALKIDAPKATVQIPSETLKSLGSDVKITMKEVTDASKINDTKALVLKTVGDSKVVGNPVEVETNFSGRTEITIPLKTENLPKDPVELKKVLDSLAVQIHHSDGENATEKGTVVYDGKGNPVGISIWVDKFSTFTVISLSKDGMDKLTANNGLISDRATQNGSNNNSAANNTNVSNVQVPEIKFVGLEHSPLIEGDKEGFIISSGYDGNVQYRIYLNVDGAWQEVTNGYSAAVSGKDTFTITPDYSFQKGQYQGRVYVKKSGAVGSKQEDGIDFDNYYTYNINCVDRDDANRVYTVGKLEIIGSSSTGNIAGTKGLDNTNSTNASAAGNMNVAENNSFKAGQKITITGIDGISGIPGPYYYRLHIYDVVNDKWTNNVIPYSEKLEWTPSAAGTYVLDIHVITPNSILWDNVQKEPTLIYGGYEGWKLKTIRVNN